MTSNNHGQLVLSIITQDRPGVVKEISEIVAQSGCNIEDSRMMVLGGSFAILMMVGGSDVQISELESRELELTDKLSSLVQMHKTENRDQADTGIPYVIEVVALDHQGIVRELSDFVAARNINIEALNTETYAAPHTGSTMFRLEMSVNVPVEVRLSHFKEALVEHCDQKNLDVTIEPITL